MTDPQDLESLLPNLDEIQLEETFPCSSDRLYAGAIKILSEQPESVSKLEIKMKGVYPRSMLVYGIGKGSIFAYQKNLFYTRDIEKFATIEDMPLGYIGSFTLLDTSINSPDYQMSTKKLLEYLETWKKQSNPMTSEEWEKFREERTRIRFR